MKSISALNNKDSHINKPTDTFGADQAPIKEPGVIQRFESWLTTPRFIGLLLLLILLNLFVYFWWFHRPVFKVGVQPVGTAMLAGLEGEKQRLQEMLDGSCDSDEMKAYRRGETGPLQRQDKKDESSGNRSSGEPPKTVMAPQSELVKLLDAATVRVITETGSIGTGFFIDRKTIVTNRHVVEDAVKKQIWVTSKVIGKTPLVAKLVSLTKDAEITNPDFAILTVESSPDSIKTLAVSVDPAVLQVVYAAGYPGSGTALDANEVTPSAVFTDGKVSVLQPQPNGVVLVVHTAHISRGSSGGALVNRCGHVVGVNTFVTTKDQEVDGRSLYALSATDLKKFIEQSGAQYQQVGPECTSAQGE